LPGKDHAVKVGRTSALHAWTVAEFRRPTISPAVSYRPDGWSPWINCDQLISFGKHIAACDLVISLTVWVNQSGYQGMHDIASLVEVYLAAERDLVAAVESVGGVVPLPDGRTVTVGRAEFDSLLGERRKRAWVVVREQAPMPARR
jgi:hypothetical protein